MVDACANCMFWQARAMGEKPYPNVDGWCRRYAPQGPVVKNSADGWQLFPPMNAEQWCGDYQRNTKVVPMEKAEAKAA